MSSKCSVIRQRPLNCLVVLLVFFMRSAVAQSVLVINEIMYDPNSGQPEWFELYNGSSEEVDLRDWTFTDASVDKRYMLSEESMILLPQQFAVVSEDSSILDIFPAMEGTLCVPNRFPALNNDDDAVVVYGANDTMIDLVEYRSDWGGGDGVSLERINPDIASTDSSNWNSCAALEGGTPGRENSIFTSVIPTEATLSASPNPFTPDGDGSEDVTVITYDLPMRTSAVNLRVYDVRGRLIRTLRGATPSGSQGFVIWDGRDDEGRTARMGIYIIYIEGLEGLSGSLANAKSTIVLGRRR